MTAGEHWHSRSIVVPGEAGRFAGFREDATATSSPLDRLGSLTLPRLDDVRDGLETYREGVARAAELDRQIQRTDDLIDEIVGLYPALSLADVHTAIAFYYADIEEVRGSHPDTDGEHETPA